MTPMRDPRSRSRSLSRARRRVAALLVTVALPGLVGTAAATDRDVGVVVTDPGTVEGLEVGDLVSVWSVLGDGGETVAEGALTGPLDLELARLCCAPRGRFVLRSPREAVESVLPPGVAIGIRPRTTTSGAAEIERAEVLRHVDPKAALERLEVLAHQLEDEGKPADAGWLLLSALRWLLAPEDLARATDRARPLLADHPAALAHLLRTRGEAERRIGQSDRSEAFLQEALALDREQAPLFVAADLAALGATALEAGRAAEGLEHFDRALEILRHLAPASLELVGALVGRSHGLFALGHLAESEEALTEAIAVQEASAPGTASHATLLGNLGRVVWAQGDLRRADGVLARALAIAEESGAGPDHVASIVNNLGLVAHDRGDYAAADAHFHRFLELETALDPGSLGVANAYNNLGMVENERGDWTAADDHYARALEIYERLQPDSRSVARALNNRSNNARRAGRLDEAEAWVRRSQGITARVAPDSLTHSIGKEVLALVLEARGKLREAAEIAAIAVDATAEEAPGTVREARPRHFLGRILRKIPRPEEARLQQEAALSIVERDAPGSALEAQILNELGRLARASGAPEDAAGLFCRAADALDEQKLKLGGNREAGNPFDRETAYVHLDCLEALLSLGRATEAFGVMERSRARQLLALLAERDLDLDASVPAELRERRRELARRYDEVYGRLLAGGLEAEERGSLSGRLEELRRERDELGRAVRDAAPRLADLQTPRPLEAGEAARALEPGTLLLAYTLGESTSHIFALSAGSNGTPLVRRISAGREEIAKRVAAYRSAIVDASPGARSLGRELWSLLLAPIADELYRHDRVLVSPDGSLHTLPFAALVGPDDRFLIERVPIHLAASATLYAALREESGSPADPGPVVAFADPDLPPGLGRGPAMVQATRHGLELGPLPGARREAAALRDLYPGRALTFEGPAATEARLKEQAEGASILHLATHAWIDPRSPLDSWLLLSPGEDSDDNGLLQAWEVFEELRTEAELVTLSACETALGTELAGEGIIGLARAFHYAGAPSIVASLWRVPDRSTASLMERFYRELDRGAAKDEALRAAQLALLRGGVESADVERGVGGLRPAEVAPAPKAETYSWAAFQLLGVR